ncbi:DUF4145 domain-containing protein [Bacillus sp. MZGC1]|uniref:DUF4145 domain-containing protein n=1 Tax=Bacillus sp. MZGC1 TaxID=2108543 RepID=UPI000D046F3B|nr:DUF4145 domain-containing protein [Bacillus sp. MZGC1]PRS46405.1 hypothetical protein C6Y06_19625 [Bacillus sp. MZGC1]
MNDMESGYWDGTRYIDNVRYDCGYCNAYVAPQNAYPSKEYALHDGRLGAVILICPGCQSPTYMSRNKIQYPVKNIMNDIKHLPDNLQELYKEVCDSFSVHAYTGASILARKMIMNIAIEKKAEENKKFVEYVEFLVTNAIVPQSTKKWLDLIRKNGNDAAHKTHKASKEDTEKIIKFLEILLRSVYEFEGEI